MAIEAQYCPNCGAPLTRNDKGGCLFCNVPLAENGPAAAAPAAPAPSGDANAPFAMDAEDTFGIRGRGLVVTGRVASGTVRPGDALVIDGPRGTIRTRCKGVEMFRKVLDKAVAGDQVGLLLEGVDKEDVVRGSRIRAAK